MSVPRLIQVTVVPTGTVMVAGVEKPDMSTSTGSGVVVGDVVVAGVVAPAVVAGVVVAGGVVVPVQAARTGIVVSSSSTTTTSNRNADLVFILPTSLIQYSISTFSLALSIPEEP